jgi:hypothetical protein
MDIPNNTNADIRLYDGEYISSSTLNRPLYRLLANDVALADAVALSGISFVAAPSATTAHGSQGYMALSGDYLYVYNDTQSKWGKVLLDYS